MKFSVTLQTPKYIRRNPKGEMIGGQTKYEIGTFSNPQAFMDFVREHRAELRHAVAVSPRDSTEISCNEFLLSEVEKVGVTEL